MLTQMFRFSYISLRLSCRHDVVNVVLVMNYCFGFYCNSAVLKMENVVQEGDAFKLHLFIAYYIYDYLFPSLFNAISLLKDIEWVIISAILDGERWWRMRVGSCDKHS